MHNVTPCVLTNCQELFYQIDRKESREPVLFSDSRPVNGIGYIRLISFRSIRLILSLMVSLLVALKWIVTL